MQFLYNLCSSWEKLRLSFTHAKRIHDNPSKSIWARTALIVIKKLLFYKNCISLIDIKFISVEQLLKMNGTFPIKIG